MNRELMEYMNGTRNVVKNEFILGRERSSKREMIFISVPGYDDPLYALFNTKRARGKYKLLQGEEEGLARIERQKPKGTGGEPAYAMLMLTAMESVIDKMSAGAALLLWKLVLCMEWNTCRVIRKRDGVPLNRNMMVQQFGMGKGKLNRLLSELIAHGIITYNTDKAAYYLNNNLVKKGMGTCG